MLDAQRTRPDSPQVDRFWSAQRPALIAALVSASAAGFLIVAFDSVSVYERPFALQSLTNSIFWIAAAMIGSCATISALVLTSVSLMEHLETRRLTPRFLLHLRLTVYSAIATIAFGVIALLLTTFPFALGADVKPPAWQVDAVFFGLQILTALMIGSFAVVLTSLASTITQVLGNLPTTWMDDILTDDDASVARPRRDEPTQRTGRRTTP